MKVLFCNIAFMKYYRGIIPDIDEPAFIGTRTKMDSSAEEQYNFSPCNMNGEDICMGFFSAKSTAKSAAQVHIEHIAGVDKTDDYVDDVLVVWCAKKEGTDNRTVVVGWYKHARVYRYYQEAIFGEEGEEFHQLYNVVANAKNCVLLPSGERCRYTRWNVPRMKGTTGPAFGFANTSNIWFATEDKAEEYVKNMVDRINTYSDENWMEKGIETVYAN